MEYGRFAGGREKKTERTPTLYGNYRVDLFRSVW